MSILGGLRGLEDRLGFSVRCERSLDPEGSVCVGRVGAVQGSAEREREQPERNDHRGRGPAAEGDQRPRE